MSDTSHENQKPSLRERVARRKERGGIIKGHWRGLYSLETSYWRHFLAYSVPLALILPLSEWETWGDKRWFIPVIGNAILYAVIIWQVVGVVRSALRTKKEGGSALWSYAAIVVSVFFGVTSIHLNFMLMFFTIPLLFILG